MNTEPIKEIIKYPLLPLAAGAATFFGMRELAQAGYLDQIYSTLVSNNKSFVMSLYFLVAIPSALAAGLVSLVLDLKK